MATLLPENIVYAGPATYSETKAYKSLGHYVLEKIRSFCNKIVLIDSMSGQEYMADFIHESIVRLAMSLQNLNVRRGDVVGLCSENCVEFAITLFASFALNATVAPFNVTYSEREMHHAINLSKPKVIFASNNTIESIAKVAKMNSFVQNLVTFGSTSPHSSIHTFRSMIERSDPKNINEFVPLPANKKEDVALIVYSSGTTGLPKGVQLTQSNILVTLEGQLEAGSPLYDDISILTVIPWFHAFGCITLIVTAVRGTKLVFLPKFDEHLFLSAIEKHRVLMLFTVPPLMVFLAKNPKVSNYDLSSIMLILCGAAPLSKETEDQIKERIGVPIIWQGYGLSESTLAVLVQTEKHCKPGSVGVLKLGMYAKVIDPETGKILGPNQRGELCFKGDCIMKGYIGDVAATEATIRDGWLHTGDVGYFDEDFEFFIVDRLKELIKYKAYQVPPAELEALLLTHPKIRDVAVIGKADEEAGELPMAFVVKQDNVTLSENDVIQFVAERVSSAKKLRGGVEFIDVIPKNPSGKILRRLLRDMITMQPTSKL